MPLFPRLLSMISLSLFLLPLGCNDPAGEDDDDDSSVGDDDSSSTDDDTVSGEIHIEHTPPAGATEGVDIPLTATVTDPAGVTEVLVHYLNVGEPDFRQAAFAPAGGDNYSGTISGADVSSSGVSYYLEAYGGSGSAVWPEGAPAKTWTLSATNVAPDAPDPVRATYVWASAMVQISWPVPADLDIASYEVYQSTDNYVDATDTLVTTTTGDETSAYQVDDVDGTLASAYSWYAVKAVDAFGEEAWSAAASLDNLHIYEGFTGNATPYPQVNDGFFNTPAGIGVDAGGNYYVADSGNHRVQVFNSSGTFLKEIGSYGTGQGQLNFPWDVEVDDDLNLWVAEYGSHRVQVLSQTGLYLLQLGTGTAGTEEGQLWFPLSLTRDGGGFVYVVDEHSPRVQKFAPDGTFVGAWTAAGAETFSAMGGVAYSPAHDGVFVTDAGAHRVYLLSTEGDLLDSFGTSGTGDGGMTDSHGVCATGWGDALVTDGDEFLLVGDSHRLSVFDNTGEFSWWFGGYGSQEGQFSIAADCAVGTNGDLWVVDRNNHRVHRYGP